MYTITKLLKTGQIMGIRNLYTFIMITNKYEIYLHDTGKLSRLNKVVLCKKRQPQMNTSYLIYIHFDPPAYLIHHCHGQP